MPASPNRISDSRKSAHDALESIQSGTLVRTGIQHVDDLMGGLLPGEFLTVAANTGVGKSSVVLAACMRLTEHGEKSGYITLEDTREVVGLRLLSYLTGIDSLRIRRKDLTEKEWAKLRETNVPRFHIADPSPTDFAAVLEAISEMASGGCRMVYVDYLQKLRPSGGDNRRADIDRYMSLMQSRCHDLGMALGLVAQMRRPAAPPQWQKETELDKWPSIHDLKESSAIEHESRAIVLLRPGAYIGDLDAKLAKCSHGGVGLRWRYVRDEAGVLREEI